MKIRLTFLLLMFVVLVQASPPMPDQAIIDDQVIEQFEVYQAFAPVVEMTDLSPFVIDVPAPIVNDGLVDQKQSRKTKLLLNYGNLDNYLSSYTATYYHSSRKRILQNRLTVSSWLLCNTQANSNILSVT